MNKQSRVFVAGHRGWSARPLCVGCARWTSSNCCSPSARELDLTRQADVDSWFAAHRPEVVIMAAAKVGGIHANDSYAAEFIRDNLAVQTNVIDAAYRNGTRKLTFLGSSCIYPKLAPQPMNEDCLLTRAARADQRVVRDRQDRRHQDVPGVPAAIRL